MLFLPLADFNRGKKEKWYLDPDKITPSA